MLFFRTFRYPLTLHFRTPRDSRYTPEAYACPSADVFREFVQDCLLVLPVDPKQPFEWTLAECTDAEGRVCLKVQKDFPAQPHASWTWTLLSRPKLADLDANTVAHVSNVSNR